MSKTKLILCDWRVQPGFRVSVGIAEIGVANRPGKGLQEIHRVDLGAIGGVSIRQKVLKTRIAAEQWIKAWYDTQELQDQLNEGVAREVEDLNTDVGKPTWPGKRC